ncbi:MAG TPA: cytochrome c3 family protein [Bryobacteraceae bacterium]|nr:cytochrome c3 family protein [Bryobacteraceae bacterium]
MALSDKFLSQVRQSFAVFCSVAECVLLVLALAASLFGQESDTLILKGSKQTYTILSRVSDPAERQAFVDLYGDREPAKRHELAQQFIQRYPQSWLLAPAYDVAAKSSIDLGQFSDALAEGRFSLRLMPENPALLVLLANLEARNQSFQAAERDARDALDDLNLFEQPENLKRRLEASAWFALGRSLVAQGFTNESLLKPGLDALDHAAACNANDPEIFYLRGLAEARAGDRQNAADDLAFASQNSDSLRPRALAALKVLHGTASAKPQVEKNLCADPPASKPTRAIQEGYAGPAACQSCHPREYETWRQTGMANMLRPYKPENILGDFSPGAEYNDESGTVRMGVDSRPYFEIRGEKFYVDYTIGSKWQQGYATKLPDGRLQVLPIEYNVLRKEWVNYWKIIDPPGSQRAIISNFPKLLPNTNYEENCAICHTSQLRAASSGDAPMEHATFLQTGVDCEMCHGPSAWHVKQARAGHIEPPLDFRRANNHEGVRVCAQCHRQSAVRTIGAHNEMNYSSTTGSFIPAAWSQPYDAFTRRAFYKDGRFRETTFIVEAFTRSACYRRGTAQCASCHAPHLPDFARNLTSLKFKDHPNEMCLGCHPQYRGDLTRHTHHAATSEASQCVACHMPRIVNALLFQARSHQIEIPTADLTERFGQQESPNACLLCHSDRDAHWAEQQLHKW